MGAGASASSGDGIVNMSSNVTTLQSKSDCCLFLGVYYDEELYNYCFQQSQQHPTSTTSEITLQSFLNILLVVTSDSSSSTPFTSQFHEKYLGILYKITLMNSDIRHLIFVNYPILSYLQDLLSLSHVGFTLKSMEYLVGILRNFSLDQEYSSDLISFTSSQNWVTLLFPSNPQYNSLHHQFSSSSSSSTNAATTNDLIDSSSLSFTVMNIYEHFLAFYHNLSLNSSNILLIYHHSNILLICKNILHDYQQQQLESLSLNWNLLQHLTGLLWNCISYSDQILNSNQVISRTLMSLLLPYLVKGNSFIQFHITGIIFIISLNHPLLFTLFGDQEEDYDQDDDDRTTSNMRSMPTTFFSFLIQFFGSCLELIKKSSILSKPAASSTPTGASSSSTSASSPPISLPISMIFDHLTGIFLSLSLYSELRVPLYKAKLIPIVMELLVISSSSSSSRSPLPLDHKETTSDDHHEGDSSIAYPPPLPPHHYSASSLSLPILSSHIPSISSQFVSDSSSRHCREIVVHLAQERSLRHCLCEEWRRHGLQPSLMSLLESQHQAIVEESRRK